MSALRAIPFAEWPYPTNDEESHLVCSDVELLRARIDMLLEERAVVTKETEVAASPFHIPLAWKLTPQENRFLLTLVSKSHNATKVVPLAVLLNASASSADMEYSQDPFGRCNLLNVLACKIRKKLIPFGLGAEISTIPRVGYAPSLALVKATLKAAA